MNKSLTLITALSLLAALYGHAQSAVPRKSPSGEPIASNTDASTNTAFTSISPGKTNFVSTARTNTAEGGFVGFDKLAGFPIPLTPDLESNTNRPAWADAQVNTMIPANVQSLDRRRFSVDGFMIPLQFEKQNVVEFILARDPPACCFATMPQIHKWIKVLVKSPGVAPMEYSTVRARGLLSGGAERQDGVLSSVYRMEADTVGKAPEK